MEFLNKISGAVQTFATQNPGFVKGAAQLAGGLAGAALGKKVGLGSTAGAIAGAALTTAAINPTLARLTGAGVNAFGMNSPSTVYAGRIDPQVTFGSGTRNIGSDHQDWRVKVTIPPGSPIFDSAFYGGVMTPLQLEKGVVFPHTPVVQLSHSAKYESQSLVHTNYSFHNYTGSETGAISITADFTQQSTKEAAYLIAAVYFFRACTKMFYGSGEFVGNPPPVVFLSGYGKYLLPRTPCVVTQFSHSLPNDVDYMVDTAGPSSTGDTTWVPTYAQLTITLQPVVSRNKQAAFNLNAFAAGQLLSTGPNGASGGFL